MENNRSNRFFKRILLVGSLALFAVSCLFLPSAALPSTQTASAPASPIIPTQTTPPIIDPSQTASQPVAGAAQLDSAGPWMLIDSQQGLWAVNSDGSGLTQLSTMDYWNGKIQGAVQPSGSLVAYISPGDYDFHHMALNLLSLPDGQSKKITDLTSAQTEAFVDSGPGDPGFESLRAIGEQVSLAWSPDGTRLAFIGAMDGPSADLYIYDLRSSQIIRVSEDPNQDFSPSWSPDGTSLLFIEAVGFGTGAGMDVSAVWVAAGDGSRAEKLYQPDSSGESIIGWLNNTTALVDSWNIVCGPNKLRLYDVVGRQETVINDGCVTAASVNQLRSSAMFSNDGGLFLFSADNLTPTLVSQEKNVFIEPSAPADQVFTVHYENGLIATFGSGTYDDQSSPVTAISNGYTPFDDQDVAEYGAIWVWTSQNQDQPGVWITGPGLQVGQIFSAAALLPAWDAHNNLLFFAVSASGGFDLYRTTFDAYYTDLANIVHIQADINSIAWLGPQ